jgi:hypothetical protein
LQVRRITQTFSNPQFFVDGADESDVVQGDLGDCWLLSGIATVASMPELIEKVCVARDEKVGVYGFIFQHDGIWRDVIVSHGATSQVSQLLSNLILLFVDNRWTSEHSCAGNVWIF